MSIVQSSPFNKPGCGGVVGSGAMRDALGGIIDLQIIGTDPGVVGPVTAPLGSDYAPTPGTLNPDGTFLIVPETDGAVYCVVLEDGTEFTITAVQSTAYLGQWYPARLLKVLAAGTTGDFSVGY